MEKRSNERISEQLDWQTEISVIIIRIWAPYPRRPNWSCRYLQSSIVQCPRLAEVKAHRIVREKFPRSGAIGPWMVTRDEMNDLVPCRYKQSLTERSDKTAEASSDRKIPLKRFAYFKRILEWLRPGDIMSGSPEQWPMKTTHPTGLNRAKRSILLLNQSGRSLIQSQQNSENKGEPQMKLASFRVAGREEFGVVTVDGIIELNGRLAGCQQLYGQQWKLCIRGGRTHRSRH